MTSNADNIMFDICQQRRRQQIYNIPLTRVELVSGPYQQGYSKTQLDMRRKVEILKYSPNKQNSQTNNQTNKEKFTSIMRGNDKGIYAQLYNLRKTADQCKNDDIISTSTSSCDVPGPIMTLSYDENVPLYNFTNDLRTRSYSSIPQDINIPWTIYIKKGPKGLGVDYIISNVSNKSEYNTFASIYFKNILNKTILYLKYLLPLSFSIDTVWKNNSTFLNKRYSINISIKSIYFSIFYNKNEGMLNILAPSNRMSKNIIISDISGGSVFNVNSINIGYFEKNYIPIVAQYGYIFDFNLKFNVNTIVKDTTNNNIDVNIGDLFESFIIKITSNPSNVYQPSSNITLSPSPPTIPSAFYLTTMQPYPGPLPTVFLENS